MSRPSRTYEEVTDPLLAALVSVPPVGPGVCRFCHGAPGSGFAQCASCHRTTRQVSNPVETIVPISLYTIPSQLHTVLRNYKDLDPGPTRDPLLLQVAGLIGRFLRDHRKCIVDTVGIDFDTIVAVPSSGGRIGAHPLEVAIDRLATYRSMLANLLEPGSEKIDESRNANDLAFRVRGIARDRRVLLVDDTFVTGARIQSAASALHQGGATVVAALAVGRVVRFDPDYPNSQALFEQASSTPFDFAQCCLEAPTIAV